ncbi:MAG TPA: GntR family transcriptional regulator [Gemmatimonadales bacterium]
MFDQIDARSPTPLYAQIADRLRVAIASGDVRPGDPLPSVRHLAARLRINPATVVQAYRDLEQDGFVEMRQGAGTFVRDVPADRRSRERSRRATQLVRNLMGNAGRLGISREELALAVEQELGVKTP